MPPSTILNLAQVVLSAHRNLEEPSIFSARHSLGLPTNWLPYYSKHPAGSEPHCLVVAVSFKIRIDGSFKERPPFVVAVHFAAVVTSCQCHDNYYRQQMPNSITGFLDHPFPGSNSIMAERQFLLERPESSKSRRLESRLRNELSQSNQRTPMGVIVGGGIRELGRMNQ